MKLKRSKKQRLAGLAPLVMAALIQANTVLVPEPAIGSEEEAANAAAAPAPAAAPTQTTMPAESSAAVSTEPASPDAPASATFNAAPVDDGAEMPDEAGVKNHPVDNEPIKKELGTKEHPLRLSTRDEGDIPIRSWRSAREIPWAVLLCIHGFGLSMNSFDKFGQRMANLGIPTYAIDVRGFGNWQNAQGHNELDFDDAIGDVQKALKAIRKAHPNLPIFLVGESMGGALALQAMAANQSLAQGLICSVPAQDRFGERAEDIKVALSMLHGIDHKTNAANTVIKQITASPGLRQELKSAPGARLDFSPRELVRFQKFMNRTDKEAKKLTSVSTLILQGGADRLVKPRGTGLVYTNLAAKNKDFVLIGSSEHLILEEGQFSDHVIGVVSSWIYENSQIQNLAKTEPNTQAEPGVDMVKAAGHLRVAQGLIDLGMQKEAEQHLTEAVHVGRGTPVAMVAERLLSGFHTTDVLPPRSDEDSSPAYVSHTAAMGNDKPTVLFFGSKWIDSAYELNNVLKRGIARYGDRVNFVRIDCDDPKNADLVDGYGINVVPTVVFLDPANTPVNYQLGALSDETLAFELPRITENVDRAPIPVPSVAKNASKKPSVIVFGHAKSAEYKVACDRIKGLVDKYKGRVDFVGVDADDPANAEMLRNYGDHNLLPVVLFTNSSKDVVAFTAGPSSIAEMSKKMQRITLKKVLPKARRGAGKEIAQEVTDSN